MAFPKALIALLLLVVLTRDSRGSAESKYAYIAFVNDVHNRIEEEQPSGATPCPASAQTAGTCVGGWARISTQVKALRLQAQREGAAVFFLDAGDEFTGTLWDVVYRGSVTALLQNQAGVDTMVLGNHEFDYGTQNLASYIRNVSFPMLGACNIDTSREANLTGLLQKFTVLQYKISKKITVKIGVVGWVNEQMGSMINPTKLGAVKFLPIVPTVNSCIKELRALHKDLDYVIGLSHSGIQSDKAVASQLQGIDLIIGGHSHTFLYTPTTAGPIVTPSPGVNASNCVEKSACDRPLGPYPTWEGSIPIVQAYYSSKYLGLVKINLSRRQLQAGAVPLLLGGSSSSSSVVQQDPEINKIVQQYVGPVNDLDGQVAGRTLVPLPGPMPLTRSNETALGNYVCDAALRSVPGGLADRAEGQGGICLINSGAIRTGVDSPGNITVGQVLAMLPFADMLAVIRVTGTQLLAAIRNGIGGYTTGKFPQVSGFRILHNNGQLVSAMLLKNSNNITAPIAPNAKYTIVVPDYMLVGGDGYNFSTAEVLLPSGEQYNQIVLEDLQNTPQGSCMPARL